MFSSCLIKHISRNLTSKRFQIIKMSEPQMKKANIEDTNTLHTTSNGGTNGTTNGKDPIEVIKDIKSSIKGTEDGTLNTKDSETVEEKNNDDKTDGSILQVKLLSENAIVPTKGSCYAAGYDLYSAVDVVIKANGKGLAKTDLAISIPLGSYARIAPRSGLSWKSHIDVGAGVVDYDYRGNVGVVMFNHATEDFHVTKGMKVAQLVLEKIFRPTIAVVEDLSTTERGSGGFGSTGA